MIGRDTADIDIIIGGDALEIGAGLATALGGKYVVLDEENGVSRVILADEVHRWEIDLCTLKGSIEQDLARRDFTIDAMAVDLGQLGGEETAVNIIDPFGGRDDLKQGVVRVVSETAFASDAVRLLRAVRLAAELGFTIESETEALIRSYSSLVAGVAGERVREEFIRLLAVADSGWWHYLDGLGLVTAVIPELAALKGVAQPKEHFWDVFGHTIETVSAVDFVLRRGSWAYATDDILTATPWSADLAGYFNEEVSYGSNRRVLLKLAALLHDLAKPQTKALDQQGRTRFLGHAEQGALTAANILHRLRFSARETKLVETAVRHHLRPTQMSSCGMPTPRAIYRYFRDTGDAGIDVLFLSLADHLATRGPHLDLEQWREHGQLVDYVLAQRFQEESIVTPPKLLSGHDLINVFSLSPGPKIGELLEAVREAQAAGEVTTRDEALDFINSLLASSRNPLSSGGEETGGRMVVSELSW